MLSNKQSRISFAYRFPLCGLNPELRNDINFILSTHVSSENNSLLRSKGCDDGVTWPECRELKVAHPTGSCVA